MLSFEASVARINLTDESSAKSNSCSVTRGDAERDVDYGFQVYGLAGF
jgi:hypothetical protein